MQLPTPFVKSLEVYLSKTDILSLTETLLSKSPVSVRKHRHKDFSLPVDYAVPWCPLGNYLDERPQFIFDPLFHAGSYYVQEASSMLLWHALSHQCNPADQPVILDLCASPGGKSTLIANFLDGNGLLISNEIIKSRAYTLKSNIAKEGYLNTIVTNNDPKHFTPLVDFFDIIVVDAPCSGEGMFRKDPKSIQEWSIDNVTLCAGRQKRILADVLPCLKENGVIIYSTCTYNAHENIENIAWMCSQFGLESIPMSYPSDWGLTDITEGNHHGYQCYPHLVRGEGFFISILSQKDKKTTHANQRPNDKTYFTPSKNQKSEIAKWLKNEIHCEYYIDKISQVHAMSEGAIERAKILANHLRIIDSGVTVGTFNKDIIIPDQGLAMSSLSSENIPSIELSQRDALLFLKKELGSVDISTKSWHLAKYKGQGLGWFKNLGNRINNYLPNELRILKSLD
jgi:16S rRNA C967 or C1407 C5-methylase (RsmB/RsmF family)/NOL1/NOP2/fmu family ribosome biogenesis protein